MGTIILQKDQKAVLSKGADFLRRLLIGLGWDNVPGEEMDLDVTLIPRRADGSPIQDDVCYYGKLQTTWAMHSPDERTGEGTLDEGQLDAVFRSSLPDGANDDERIVIPDMSKVPAEVVSFDIVVTIYDAAKTGQNFGRLTMAYVRIEDPDGIISPHKYELTADDLFVETGVLLATFSRKGPTWVMEAKGEAGGRWNSLETAIPV